MLRSLIFVLVFAIPLQARAEAPRFVNIDGFPPPIPGTADEVHPVLEKLVAQPADLWDRLRQGFAIPPLEHKRVAESEAWYAARPELLRAILGRAKLYLHHIVEEIERRSMPTELALLPVVESGFNPQALSSARASGLWQFIPGTGARFGLNRGASFDARRDVLASTRAALDYLQSLYAMHKDWHLALASYNWGENAVGRSVERSVARGGSGEFASISMPEETRSYVPRLMAIRNIVADPAKFGLDLGELPNDPYFTRVIVDLGLDLRIAATLAGMPYEELLALNPAYRETGGGELLVPTEREDALRAGLQKYREEQRNRSERRPAPRKK